MNIFEEELRNTFDKPFKVYYEPDFVKVKLIKHYNFPEIWFDKVKNVKLHYVKQDITNVNYETVRSIVLKMRVLIDMYPDEYERLRNPGLADLLSQQVEKSVSVNRDGSTLHIKGENINLKIDDNTVMGYADARDKRIILETLQAKAYFSGETLTLDYTGDREFKPGDIITNGKATKMIIGQKNDVFEMALLFDGKVCGYSKWPLDRTTKIENNYEIIYHYDDVEAVKKSLIDMLSNESAPLQVCPK